MVPQPTLLMFLRAYPRILRDVGVTVAVEATRSGALTGWYGHAAVLDCACVRRAGTLELCLACSRFETGPGERRQQDAVLEIFWEARRHLTATNLTEHEAPTLEAPDTDGLTGAYQMIHTIFPHRVFWCAHHRRRAG